MARGEFSIVIAGLAVGAEPRVGPLATAYVLLLVILGPLTARWAEPAARRLGFSSPAKARPLPETAAERGEGTDKAEGAEADVAQKAGGADAARTYG